jgi:hypothetical protein
MDPLSILFPLTGFIISLVIIVSICISKKINLRFQLLNERINQLEMRINNSQNRQIPISVLPTSLDPLPLQYNNQSHYQQPYQSQLLPTNYPMGV